MIIKNSLSVVTSRMGVIFKVLIYDVIILAILGGAGYLFLRPYIDTVVSEITSTGLIEKFLEFIGHIFTDASALGTLSECGHYQEVVDALAEVNSLFSSNALTPAYFILAIVFVLGIFLLNLKNVPVAEIIANYMDSNSSDSFMTSYIRNFGRSALYSLLYTIISIILDVIIFSLVLSGLASVVELDLIVFLIIEASLMLIITIKILITCGWLPHMIIKKECPLKALWRGIKGIFGDLRPMFGLVLGYVVISWMAIALSISTTLGLALLLILPLIFLWLRAIELVRYYDVHSLPYYTNDQNVVHAKVDVIDITIDHED